MDNPHIIDVLRSRERCPSKNNPPELFRRVLPCTERLVLWGFVLMSIDYHVYFEFARGKSALNLNLGFATKTGVVFVEKIGVQRKMRAFACKMIVRIPKGIGMTLCSMLKWLKTEEDD